MSNFDKDLKQGIKAEDEVLALVKKKYPSAYRVKGHFQTKKEFK